MDPFDEPRRPIVVILGMHRSGTSLAGHLLSALGLQLGDRLLPADEWNARGYWEHAAIYELQDELQRRLDRVWHEPVGALPLPDGWLERQPVRAIQAKLTEVLREELGRTPGLWGFKDPRTASFLPLWHRIFEELRLEPRYLISVREPDAVIASLARRNLLPASHSHVVWTRTYVDAVKHTGGAERAFVDYDRWFVEPQAQLQAAAERLGLAPLDAARVSDVVDAVVESDLRHHGPEARSDADAAAAAEPHRLHETDPVDLLFDVLSQAVRGAPIPDGLSWFEAGCRAGDEALAAWTEREAPASTPSAAVSEPPAPEHDAAAKKASRIEPLPVPGDDVALKPKRVCIVSSEFIGPYKNGGIGTANTTLGHALADAGHDVTLLYTRGECENHTFEHWTEHYASQGIRFVPLPAPEGPRNSGPASSIRPYEVYRWLRDNDTFDVIHFHEMSGLGYYVLNAREQRVAFDRTTICVGTHSPHEWLRDANREYLREPLELELDFVERRCVALADVVWSPSRYMLEWMQSRGWPLGERCYVQPNILPRSARGSRAADEAHDEGAEPVREIVFFGRLETRKGITLFCDAIDRLCESAPKRFAVTFLGRHANVEGRNSKEWLEERTRDWTCRQRVIDSLDQPEAMAYLKEPGRVAVIASPVDNSPCTVAECLGARIPLLACRSGGIPELIAEDDARRICFPYVAEDLESLLLNALEHGVAPSRPAQDFDTCERTWVRWHGALSTREERRAAARPERRSAVDPLVSVCIPHFNRPELLQIALDSVRAQDYRDIEVIVCDDGSTDPAAIAALDALEPEFTRLDWKIVRQENRYLGAARNTAARHARGEYLVFLDDDNYAKPRAIRTLVEAARATQADVVTCFMDFFRGDGAPPLGTDAEERWLFLGGAPLPGIYRNVFGDAFALVRRAAFESLGGFTEDHGVTHEDWELFAKAALEGLRFEVVADGLFWYRVSDDSMIRTTDLYQNNMRHMRPYAAALPEGLGSLATFSQAQQFRCEAALNALGNVAGLYTDAVRSVLDCLQVLGTAEHPEETRTVLMRCLDLAATSGNPEVMMEALFVAGAVMARIGDPRQARRLATMAVDAARQQHSVTGLARASELLAAVERLDAIHAQGGALPAGGLR